MPLHTKKEFASMCGITTAVLSTYASETRRKVIYTNEYVDSSIEPNKSFLEKWKDKNRDKIKPNQLRITRPPTLKEASEGLEKEEWPNEEYDESPISEATGLDAKKLKTQILKMEKEIEKLTLSNAKTQGEVVPVGLMDAILLQERQSILMESKNTLQDVLSIFAKRRDLNAEEKADIRGEFLDRLNEMMKRSAEATSKAIKEIVAQYSIKKTVGGRN